MQPRRFMNFHLEFRSVGNVPTRALNGRSFLLYNQCDGYHIAEAMFAGDGKFQHFHFFARGEAIEDDFYVAWAVLPDTLGRLYPHFARAALAGEV